MNSFLSLGMYNAIQGVKSLMRGISDDIAAQSCDILLLNLSNIKNFLHPLDPRIPKNLDSGSVQCFVQES